MLRTSLLVTLFATFTTLTTSAPAQLRTFGGDGQLQTSSVYLWDTGSKRLVGGYSFLYGAPEWKDAHDAHVKSKESGSIRLGKNEWSTLDTSVDLTIGGTRIPAGQWYLGLRREDGRFFLMVMDAASIRKQKVGSWMTSQVKARIQAPLQYARVDDKASLLRITAAADPKDPVHGTFTLHWGNHQLTARIQAAVAPAKGEPKKPAGNAK